MRTFKLFLTFILISLLSCSPSDDSGNNPPADNFAANFGASASRDFIGQVVDVDNNPIQNASVKIGTSTVQTDINGVFIINGASVYEKFAYIKVEKAGYMDGFRSLMPTTGKNNVKIMMKSISTVAAITFSSGSPRAVELTSGHTVVFDGAFEDEKGNTYSGSVRVAIVPLSVSDQSTNSLMPGRLYGKGADGQAKALKNFGMMHVDIRGSSGQKLQIAKGHTAKIEIKIDAAQMMTAPATIPLWHFDETNGYWKQQGTATKDYNRYVGTVTHFSWWGCFNSFPTVGLSVSVVDVNGNQVPYLEVMLTDQNGFTTLAYLDSNGQASGGVPANESFTLKIYSLYCGGSTLLYSASIGPFNMNTILPAISLPAFTASTQITGQLLKCDGSNVNNGYVILKNNSHVQIAAVSNGIINLNTFYCTDSVNFTLEAFDYDSFQSTGIINYNFTTPNTNVGSLTVCNTITEFISYQIDNEPIYTSFSDLQAGFNSGSFYITGTDAVNINEGGIVIYGVTIIPGIYDTSQFSFHGGGANVNDQPINNAVSFHLNNFGAVGEFIDMTFVGTYEDTINSIIVTKNINGTVHVKRDN